MIVLGIETSCDETAAALVGDDRTIYASQLHTQVQAHIPYGGVVPEIAARQHLWHLEHVITQTLEQAHMPIENVDGIAVTAGPGLIGGVIVGTMAAKALAAALNKPFLAINHLEGHALTARLDPGVEYPYLLLLVSGGHCQLVWVEQLGVYTLLGQTLDDAAGEAFDKVAQTLGLDYPGGPAIEKLARQGDPHAYPFPRPLLGRTGCDFSFSGLKTAVRQKAEQLEPLQAQQRADIAASFQEAITVCLVDRVDHALTMLGTRVKTCVLAGGVAANSVIRERLNKACQERHIMCVAPPLELCTDNAAMIAWAGIERLHAGLTSPLDFAPRPRWPLTDLMSP